MIAVHPSISAHVDIQALIFASNSKAALESVIAEATLEGLTPLAEHLTACAARVDKAIASWSEALPALEKAATELRAAEQTHANACTAHDLGSDDPKQAVSIFLDKEVAHQHLRRSRGRFAAIKNGFPSLGASRDLAELQTAEQTLSKLSHVCKLAVVHRSAVSPQTETWNYLLTVSPDSWQFEPLALAREVRRLTSAHRDEKEYTGEPNARPEDLRILYATLVEDRANRKAAALLNAKRALRQAEQDARIPA